MFVEIKASVVQCAIFVVGLALSLVVGMFLSGQLDGAPGLLFATIVASAGLLWRRRCYRRRRTITSSPRSPIRFRRR